MEMEIKLNTDINKCATSTLRTWINLIELTEEMGHPLVLSAYEISEHPNVSKRVSRRSVGKALVDLELLGMIQIVRRGNVSIITIKGIPTKLTGHLAP